MHVHFYGEGNDGMSTSSHHARALAEMGWQVSFSDPPHDLPIPANPPDICHVVTSHPDNRRMLGTLTAAGLGGAKLVRFWCGPDLLLARFHAPSRQFALALAKLGCLQLARSEQIARSLKELFGFEALVPPVISPNLRSTSDPSPMPQNFTALCRLPSSFREYYGGQVADHLIAHFPTVRFLVLGDVAAPYRDHANVESLGVVEDISRTIRRSSVLIDARLDRQLSRLALEMLSHGRHVISGHAAPYFRYAQTLEEFVSEINHLRPRPAFNLTAREYVCKQHDYADARKHLSDLLEALVENRCWSSTIRGVVQSVGVLLTASACASNHQQDETDGANDKDFIAYSALMKGESQLLNHSGIGSAAQAGA